MDLCATLNYCRLAVFDTAARYRATVRENKDVAHGRVAAEKLGVYMYALAGLPE